jgi:hypothetical protein
MNKTFLIMFSLLIALILAGPVSRMTGFVISGADVSVQGTISGKITGLNYKSNLNVSEIQNITAEFTNVGSMPIASRIELTLYFYNETRLEPIAYYYDSYVQLLPGDKRSFEISLIPPYYGTYYIKVRVPYETKVTELWGVFSVSVIYITPPPVIVIMPQTQGTVTYNTQGGGISSLTAEYQKSYDLNPGQSQLISVNAINNGDVILYNLRFSTSTSNLITTEVNPKVLSILNANRSNFFLISVTIPKDIPLGVYPLNFEIMSDKAVTTGSISLNITSAEISLKDEVNRTILNYDYLVSDLEKKVADAISEGLDVTEAQKSFDSAKEGLQRAKEYFLTGDYQSARDKLDEIKKDFEDVVFQLANARLNLYVTPAFSPFIILIFAIIVGIIFLFLLRRRRENRRPKLFREVSEET